MAAAPSLATRKRTIHRSLTLSIAEGLLHAVMLGAAESYFGALAVELGHRDVSLSVLATVPLFAGALSQLLAPRLVRALGTERRAVVLGVAVQALSHAAFVALSLTGSRSLTLLLLAKVAYWVSGMMIAPAWSAWMTRLVPTHGRARFFARRFWLYHVVLVIAFLGSGQLLADFDARGSVLVGFAVLQAVALAARLLGSTLIAQKGDVDPPLLRPRVALSDVVRKGRWRIAAFGAILLFGAQIAVPFFTPYMLEDLGMSLREFAWLTSLSIVAKGLAFGPWRRIAPRIGHRRALGLAGLMVASVPVFWFASRETWMLAIAQVIGGVAWAGYELISLELLMADAPEDSRVEFYALASTLSGGLQVAGAVIGGLLLRTGAIDYATVFLISAGGRGLALIALLWVPVSVRAILVHSRVISVRPSAGAIRAPEVVDRRLGSTRTP
ncbi:MAG: MFS transporter [Sandaracinaceae bacterium]